MVRDGLPLPFSEPIVTTRMVTSPRARSAKPRLSPTEGVMHELLGDYAI
jgi:hypothetical protein